MTQTAIPVEPAVLCERCRVCPAVHTHHRKRRSQGGDDSAREPASACASPATTGSTTTRRDAAAAGWLVLSWHDPTDDRGAACSSHRHRVAHATVYAGRNVSGVQAARAEAEGRAPRPRATGHHLDEGAAGPARERRRALVRDDPDRARDALRAHGLAAERPDVQRRDGARRPGAGGRATSRWPMHEPVQFFVRGTPRAQGSKRHVGHGIMVEMSKDLAPWRQAIAAEAAQHNGDDVRRPRPGPVRLLVQAPARATTARGRRGPGQALGSEVPVVCTGRRQALPCRSATHSRSPV